MRVGADAFEAVPVGGSGGPGGEDAGRSNVGAEGGSIAVATGSDCASGGEDACVGSGDAGGRSCVGSNGANAGADDGTT
ncbi:hypothetical protein AURDEDRAFT_112163 [Auricularia subglabra TFB-10046 SS5]|nr:hypothetical protein AURDEDRAFT_112163 [Auricularia subglabra TFB-10046 SS5]